jgi:non-ribosomal peptide synthetase-like protein
MPTWLFEYGKALGSVVLALFVAGVLGLAAAPVAWAVERVYVDHGAVWTGVALPFAWLAWGLLFSALIVAFKWLTWSRFSPGTYSFASFTVARWAVLNYLVVVDNRLFLWFWQGTSVLTLWYRALGARIGRRVTINTTMIGDWDMLTIGDDAFIAADAFVVCHLGEHGHLRFAPVHIGDRCTVGLGARVFPGVVMKDGSALGANSLVKKFTELGENEIWGGVPARCVKVRGAQAGDATAEVSDQGSRNGNVTDAGSPSSDS